MLGVPDDLNPSGAWEGDSVRDEPGQTLLGCGDAGDGQQGQVSHPGALSEQLMVLLWWHHCLLCLWAQLVGLVCQEEESLELCELTPVFSLCKRELDLCPIFAAVPMSTSW